MSRSHEHRNYKEWADEEDINENNMMQNGLVDGDLHKSDSKIGVTDYTQKLKSGHLAETLPVG